MKILLYGLNFAPETTGIGKYSGEMAAWLAGAGHEVHVISAPPYYPAWKIDPSFGAASRGAQSWQGVRVWRAPLWVPADPTATRRVLHLLSFAVGSLPALLRQAFWGPDIVIVVAPALACAPAGWIAARLCGAKAWLHVQDFEVDAAFRMGLLKGGWMQKVVGWVESRVLRRFDRVSTISNRMAESLRSKQVDAARVVSFPNWVDVSAIMPLQHPSAYRVELGIAPEAVVALYSGSMVGKQGLDLLPAAARLLRERLPNLVFVFCGEGVFKPVLERECAGLSNVRLLPLQPAARLGELLGLADIHLLTQQALAADLVMPSKLTGMLASGRAIVATAQPGTEISSVVSGRGIVVPPNDLTAFAEALATLVAAPGLRLELGLAARRYAEEHLARDRVLLQFERELKRCVGPLHGALADSTSEPPSTHGDDLSKTT